MAKHNLLGNKGEMLAARYLMGKDYAIDEYNWRSGHKEIDLIARHRDMLVFVEVKSRSTEEYGAAADAVTPQKMRRLIDAAEAYIVSRKIDLQYRFDIITVVGDGEHHEIEHIEDAFIASW